MAVQGCDPQRQDGTRRVRADAGRDRPGDPGAPAPLPGRLDVRKPLAAPSPARGGNAGQKEPWRPLSDGPAGKNRAGAHQPGTEAAESPDNGVGRAEVEADRWFRQVTAFATQLQ